MKLKLILLAAFVLIAGSTSVVLVVQSKAHKEPLPQPPSQLPAAISNYNRTFKLNTNPPLWPEPQKSGGTNGLSAK